VQFFDFTPQSQFYRQAERPLLQQIRAARAVDRKRFFEKVETHVDAGIPPLWTVMLNVADEKPGPPIPEVTGHMRTITGYNRGKQLLVFRDTWGADHKRKALSYNEAWLITTGLFSLEPKGVRP